MKALFIESANDSAEADPARSTPGTGRVVEVGDEINICGILASRITLAHFSVSLRMRLPKSVGEPGSTMPPNSAKRAFSRGIGKPLR